MILQNLAKAIREQNYYAVVLEFLIVIAGVVIGFQITGWGEARSQDRFVEVSQANLLVDFLEIREQARSRVASHTQILQSLQALSATLDDPDIALSERDATLALSMGGFFWGPPKPSNTYRLLIASGRPDLIDDERLRTLLDEYERGLTESASAFSAIASELTQYSPAFSRHSRIDGQFDIPAQLGGEASGAVETDLLDIAIPLKRYDLDAMRSDEAFLNALDQHVRMQFYYMANHDLNASNADAVIAHLESRS